MEPNIASAVGQGFSGSKALVTLAIAYMLVRDRAVKTFTTTTTTKDCCDQEKECVCNCRDGVCKCQCYEEIPKYYRRKCRPDCDSEYGYCCTHPPRPTPPLPPIPRRYRYGC
ncbi:hypothetical protein Ciccas_004593 [Cichlidogyrus casuarinus]|uniref:Uncharacterized protein n=1 Tax=Cichlidogyrus casuarinus TaxID=1844966 RepID=A0ABD2QBX7_9PLAT